MSAVCGALSPSSRPAAGGVALGGALVMCPAEGDSLGAGKKDLAAGPVSLPPGIKNAKYSAFNGF